MTTLETSITENKTVLTCKSTKYNWTLGIGVQIDVYKAKKHVGRLRLLCDNDHPSYNRLARLTPYELLEHTVKNLSDKVFSDDFKNMRRRQNKISKAGFDCVSPIYGQLLKD